MIVGLILAIICFPAVAPHLVHDCFPIFTKIISNFYGNRDFCPIQFRGMQEIPFHERRRSTAPRTVIGVIACSGEGDDHMESATKSQRIAHPVVIGIIAALWMMATMLGVRCYEKDGTLQPTKTEQNFPSGAAGLDFVSVMVK